MNRPVFPLGAGGVRLENEAAREYLLADARVLLEGAIGSQGVGALAAPRSAAAYHEAGHAVQYRAERQPVRRVTVKRRGEHWGGYIAGGGRWI